MPPDQITLLLDGLGVDRFTMDTKTMVSTLEAILYVSGALKFLIASPITGDLFCSPKLMLHLSEIHETLGLLSRDLQTGSDASLLLPIYHVLLQVATNK